MKVKDLIDILQEAKEEGIERVEVKETTVSYYNNDRESYSTYEELDGVMIDRGRKSVVLDLYGL